MALLTSAIQTYSILATALAAGANLSTSVITFPALLHAKPPVLTEQWHILYNTGITPVVGLAATGSAGFATLAYRAAVAPGLSSLEGGLWTKRNLYIAAAAVTIGFAPYTRVVMWDTIQELERRARRGEADDKENTRELVLRWGTLNLWRGVLLLTGAGLGMWASVV
ncbi:unnamed protein product [Periconia digitata]|uniref:DUF1772-domain-containing protein n=1 Tax=Periconia digitata TaxID=1303443 RepID=A0A9W4U6B4_9PLEO|nr:unnamed protein product [Periconia digitata]